MVISSVYGYVSRARSRACLLSATCLALSVPVKGFAQCVATGSSVSCSGTTGSATTDNGNSTALIGNGSSSPITSVVVNADSSASYARTVISIGSGTEQARNTITISGTVTGAGVNTGPNGTGGNAIEFGSNTDVVVQKGGVVEVLPGGSENSEAINPTGAGNTITNYGTIKSPFGNSRMSVSA